MRIINFDWAMKYLLRQKENFDILDGFLSTLLNKDIKVLELIEPESSSESEEIKINRVDLMVKSENEQFIIEIQNNREIDYFERILFGTSKVIVENLKLGKKYKNIKKVISVNILYFNLGTGEDYIYHGKTEFLGVNKKDKLIIKRKVFINDKNFKFEERNIFPEYFLIKVEKFKEIIGSEIDEWIYMFKTGEIKENFKAKGMDSVKKKLNYLNMSLKEQKAYDRYLIDLERQTDILETAELDGYNKAKKEDKKLIEKMEKARIKAIKKEQEAKQKEKEAKQKEKEVKTALINTVKLLLSFNTDVKQISKVTGLSISEIKGIENQNSIM